MDKKEIIDLKGLPVYLQADVVVCGGGTAGVFAAVAAAKEGASVLLVEALGGLGGSAVNGLVLPMMSVHMKEEPRCSYLHQDMMKHLEAYLPDRINENSFDPLILGVVLEQMCTENGIDILLDAVLCDVATDGGAVRDIAVMCQGGIRRISGKVFIDCTGDGILSVLAGAEYEAGAPGSKINQPMSLRYLLGGVDVSTMRDDAQAEIRNKMLGFIFQQYNLLPKLTVQENVELSLLYAGVPAAERRERALAALNKVGLAAKAKNMPNQLSGGQQQRVSIARALAGDPSVILADEPTGALDSRTSREVLSFLQQLNREGNTIVLITHDNSIAVRAQRIIRLQDGRIIYDGPSDDPRAVVQPSEAGEGDTL